MALVHKDRPVPKLPIVDLCEDRVTLPVVGVASQVDAQASPIQPAWQRWNDYGIASLLEGGAGGKRGEPKQAAAAFRKLLTLGVKEALPHAHVNLARVLIEEGRLTEAAVELEKARTTDPPAPWWLVAWFNGIVQAEQANSAADLDKAIGYFEQIVDPAHQPRERKFDFTKDYMVLERLGQTFFRRSQMEASGSVAQVHFLQRAIARYQEALGLDPELMEAHFGLNQCYARLAPEVAQVQVTDSPVNSSQELVDQVSRVINETAAGQRRRLAVLVTVDLRAWVQQPLDVYQPRLPMLQQTARRLTEAYLQTADPEAKLALAPALSQVHLEIHALLKPDELARARAIRIYRSKYPAASAAADPIVIYPTDHDLQDNSSNTTKK